MDDIKKFSSAILAGIQGGQNAPGVTGISSEANRAFASRMRSPIVDKGAGVGIVAGSVADAEEARRKAAQQKKLQELQDMLDPGKYQRVRKDDGGFSFFDPTGKEIGIDQYTRRTGLRAVDVLKDSENPLDLQFVNDYSNMNELMQAAFNGENDTVKKILQNNGLDENMQPQTYMQELVRKYPHIYGAGRYEDSRRSLNNPLFKIPTQSEGSDTMALLQQMMQQSRMKR